MSESRAEGFWWVRWRPSQRWDIIELRLGGEGAGMWLIGQQGTEGMGQLDDERWEWGPFVGTEPSIAPEEAADLLLSLRTGIGEELRIFEDATMKAGVPLEEYKRAGLWLGHGVRSWLMRIARLTKAHPAPNSGTPTA
jgi:hypothetical protein